MNEVMSIEMYQTSIHYGFVPTQVYYGLILKQKAIW